MTSLESDCERPGHAGDITKKEAEVGILPSHGMILRLNPSAISLRNKWYRHFPGCAWCDGTGKASHNPASVC